MPEVRSPTVRRRELGALLRVLRTEKGLTVEQVADHLMCSPSKVSRMETGRGLATPRDIRDLCDLYEVTDTSERDRMMDLAQESKQQDWWQSHDLVYGTYAGLEAAAVGISAFQSPVIHGLLHTAAYAQAGHEGAMPLLDQEQIQLRIEARLTRQRILTLPARPVSRWFSTRPRCTGRSAGREVMADQLDKIADLSALPNVTVQILPFELGAHPALESNFTILELPDPTYELVSAHIQQAVDLPSGI